MGRGNGKQIAPLILPRDYLFILLAWVLLGLIESSQAYVQAQMAGSTPPPTISGVLIVNMPWWLLWAGLTPVIFRLAALVPFEGTGRRVIRAGGLHLVVGAGVAVIHLWGAAFIMYYAWTGTRGISNVGQQFSNFFRGYFMTDLLTYGLVLAGFGVLTYARRAARLELLATEARLDALRLQLNPHFLFNALNAVSGLVRRRENDEAVRMLTSLGDLLRATLDERALEVTLGRELEVLDQYLAIERTRFRDRLTVAVDVAPALRGALVPALVLQPLVENAIRHGVSGSPQGGSITITAARENGTLVLRVTDSGPGLGHGTDAREGIGVTNTRRRLEAQFGEGAVLRLRNVPSPATGMIAEVELPYREDA